MSPRYSVHPWVWFYVALEIYVDPFLDGAAVNVTAEFQVDDRYVCGKQNNFMRRRQL